MVCRRQGELLTPRASFQSVTGRRKWKRTRLDNVSIDLFEHDFVHHGANQVRVTYIAAIPTSLAGLR